MESPLQEGPLDWGELGEFYGEVANNPTQMRVGLTTAMMRVDTPSSPMRPISRAATAAKQADRFGTLS